jgi:O-antigen/teichoic acid export membrane protein
MSTAARLISGSAASWARICVTIISQVVLVPLYLSHWDVDTYGMWLAIQALAGLLFTIDFGHQEYLGFEFMRLGISNIDKISKYLYSGIIIGLILSIIQLLIICVLIGGGILHYILGNSHVFNKSSMTIAGFVLISQGIAWLVSTSVTGLLFRALAPFGYYPRMAWWNFFSAIVTTIAPITAVIMGAKLLMTGLVTAGITVLFSLPLYYDLFSLLKKEKIPFSSPNLRLGLKNFYFSLAVFGKISLENLRQQGVRIVLAPLSGVAALAAFSTMRTGANVALQGLNTITNPIIPDLMRFLQQRDQARSESAFGTVWIVLVALMAPGVVILQAIIEPLYIAWTRGQIPFNPWLFAALSLSVLVFAVVQPATTVVVGNNLLKPQLLLSALGAITVVMGMYILVPIIGILGAGVALLIAEIFTTIGYKIVAQQWLEANGLQWPSKPFFIAVLAVVIAALSMILMILLPEFKGVILLISMLAFSINIWKYWQVLPAIAIEHTIRILNNLPGIKKAVSLKQ